MEGLCTCLSHTTLCKPHDDREKSVLHRGQVEVFFPEKNTEWVCRTPGLDLSWGRMKQRQSWSTTKTAPQMGRRKVSTWSLFTAETTGACNPGYYQPHPKRCTVCVGGGEVIYDCRRGPPRADKALTPGCSARAPIHQDSLINGAEVRSPAHTGSSVSMASCRFCRPPG